MNYKRIYDRIISNRINTGRPEGYTERHHIKPVSLGGTDDKENLIDLTAREHFVCHLLLTKIYSEGSVEWKKMIKAFMMMLICKSKNQERYITSRTFAVTREMYSRMKSEELTGEKNMMFGTIWIQNETTQQSKRIPIDQAIPDGWIKGRFSKSARRKQEIREKKKRKRDSVLEEKIHQLEGYWKIYRETGWKKFREVTGYPYSQENLVTAFAKYVKTFVPQRGKAH